MRRFFTMPQNIEGDRLFIIDDAAHITKVLRMDVGDTILVFDGSGYEYMAQLSSVSKDQCEAIIKKRSLSEYDPSIYVTLYQGIPKAGKMETIIQKAVELGVWKVVPVCMERCVARIDSGKKGADKIARYQKVAVEAAKQCGRGVVPEIRMPVSFEEAVAELEHTELSIMPYELLGHDGERSLRALLKSHPKAKNIGVLIGPEGGFADAEAQSARQNGINQVGLGKRILRTETAGSTLLSIIMYEKDEI